MEENNIPGEAVMETSEPSLKTNVLALASVITGALAVPSLCCYYAGVIPGIAAIILGAIGLKQLKERMDTEKGKGLAIAGIVLGSLAIAFAAISFLFIGTLTLAGPSIGNVFSTVIEDLATPAP